LTIIQLWNQPSVRILGFGKEFAGFIPDQVTDLLHNPAYLKTGKDSETHDGLQIHSMMRPFISTDLATQTSNLEFFETDELLSLFILYPKVGIGYRIGAWQRNECRSYFEVEPWLFVQQGFIYSMRIRKYFNLGIEYNFSWNNRPDRFDIVVKGTIHNWDWIERKFRWEWSNEGGLGILLSNNTDWQFSFACKKNWEVDSYYVDTLSFTPCPDGRPLNYESRYSDFQSNAKIKYLAKKYKIIFQLSYFEKNIKAWQWYYEQHKFECKNATHWKPGLGFIYQLSDNVFVNTAIIYAIDTRWTQSNIKKLIIPVSFEMDASPRLKCRFGDVFTYSYSLGYYPNPYYYFKNELNLGLDIKPYEKLIFSLATSIRTNSFEWFFGLGVSL
jgi:hypothetical protein